MQRPCVLVPALNAALTLGHVLDDLRAALEIPIVVIDDGSTDSTAALARSRGAAVVRHTTNRGKGAAIRSGLEHASHLGHDVAVTVDADGQHPARSVRRVLEVKIDRCALVLGVRDLILARAPLSNRFGNAVSNFFLSLLSGKRLHDTQCGLRRYPIAETLALGARSRGYGFEAEVILRAVAARLPLVEVAIDVLYPEAHVAHTHFRNVRDPARIVADVVRTALELRMGGP